MARKKATEVEVVPEAASVPLKKAKGVKVEGEGPKLRGEGSNYPLAEAFREAIRASGLAQNEVAERARVDKGVISRLMAGTRDINGATLDQLMRVLGGEISFKKSKGDG